MRTSMIVVLWYALYPALGFSASITFENLPGTSTYVVSSVQVSDSEWEASNSLLGPKAAGWESEIIYGGRRHSIGCTTTNGGATAAFPGCVGWDPRPFDCSTPASASAVIRKMVGATMRAASDPVNNTRIYSMFACVESEHNPRLGWLIRDVSTGGAPPVPASCTASTAMIELRGVAGDPVKGGAAHVNLVCTKTADVTLTLPRGGRVDLGAGGSSYVSFGNSGSSVAVRASPTAIVPVTASGTGITPLAGVYTGSTEVILEVR